MNIEGPLSRWLSIGCKGGVDFVSAANGYKWSRSMSDDFYVFANAKHVPEIYSSLLSTQDAKFVRPEYTSRGGRKLSHDGLRNLNRFLSEELGFEVYFKDVYFIRFFSSKQLSFELYIFTELDEPKYIYLDVNQAHEYEPTVLRVEKTK